MATVWDLNQGVVKFGYDHVNYDSLTGDNSQNYGGQPSGYSEVVFHFGGLRAETGHVARAWSWAVR